MFERFNLKDNSFPITPSDRNEVKWFGFSPLKREFETVMHRSGAERLRLCVLNRGRFGAGKTHAAKYFSDMYAAKTKVGEYARFVSILVESPKHPQKAFMDFATRLFNAITFRRISEISQNLRALYGLEQLFNRLLAATGSEDIATALAQLDGDNLLASKAFLLGGGSARELRDLGLAKKLTSEHDFALAVVGILQLIIHGASDKEETPSRVLLWVDEMEDLVYFPTRYYLPFAQAMREVIDNTNEHLTLMLNFTFSEPEDLPAIETVLGQAIMQRVNHHIIFQPPNLEDLREYLLGLFRANRVRSGASRKTFPFSEPAFSVLVESGVGKTPRFINKLCDLVLRELNDMPESVLQLRRGGIPRDLVEEKLPHVFELLEEARG